MAPAPLLDPRLDILGDYGHGLCHALRVFQGRVDARGKPC